MTCVRVVSLLLFLMDGVGRWAGGWGAGVVASMFLYAISLNHAPHELVTINQQDFLKVTEENKKDALKDEDGNGIADVDELDATRYFLRKVNG
jgi:hypothetical protein